jgi:nitrogen regulatory protein PII
MQMTSRKKLEIIVEAPTLRRVETFLEEAGVRGWTVLPSLKGHGAAGDWTSGDFIPGQEKRLILAVLTSEVAERVLERLGSFFEDYPDRGGHRCPGAAGRQVLRRPASLPRR